MIAKRHLLPKERKRHGLTGNTLRVSDDAIREIITLYTRESGVRLLERELAAVCRKVRRRDCGGRVQEPHRPRREARVPAGPGEV